MSQINYGVGDTILRPFRYEVPLTGFSLLGGVEEQLIINPAGTLATGTLTLPLNPADNQVYRITSTQIQTALTVAASAGDTIAGVALTALAAGVTRGYRYRLASRFWLPSL